MQVHKNAGDSESIKPIAKLHDFKMGVLSLEVHLAVQTMDLDHCLFELLYPSSCVVNFCLQVLYIKKIFIKSAMCFSSKLLEASVQER